MNRQRRRRPGGELPTDVVGRGLEPTDDSLEASRRFAAMAQPPLESMSRVARTDPAAAIATLRYAYKHQRDRTAELTDLDQIATRLGSLAMREALTGLSKRDSIEQRSPRAAEIRDHSVRVAALSAHLAEQFDEANPALVYLSGLLHDVGKLLLIQARELTYLNVPPRFDQPNLLNIYERRTLGYDHAKLGWHALSVWGLPAPIPTAIAWHHQGSRAYMVGGQIALVVALVRAGDMLDRLLDEQPELDPSGLWRIERNLACRYLEISPEQIRRQWPELQEAQAKALPSDEVPDYPVSAE